MLFSQVRPPGAFNCEFVSHASELEQEGTEKGPPLWGWEQDAAKNVLEQWASTPGWVGGGGREAAH